MRKLADPPPLHAKAQFAADFGARFIVTIEISDAPPSADCDATSVTKFQHLAEEEGFSPIWLLDGAAMQSPEVVDALYAPVAKRRAEVGILQSASAPENLANLRDRLGKAFGTAPLIQRVHGQSSCLHCGSAGFAMDSSVRPLFDLSDQGGANYRTFPLHPYWIDEAQTLLELPLTTTYWGMLRRQGGLVQPLIEHNPALCRAMERLGLLERIPLTPEGVSVEEAIRSIDMALDDGLPLLTFSAQAQSLTQSQDWWLRVLAYLELRGVQSTNLREIMDKVIRD